MTDVTGRCAYEIHFSVPNVGPGRYPVTGFEFGEHSASAFRGLTFRVTS